MRMKFGRFKMTIKSVSFNDLVEMDKYAYNMKHNERCSYDKWQRVQDKIKVEIKRRMKVVFG